MADIDREKFAYAVAAKLDEQELSFSKAQTKFKGVTGGILSKIRHGTPISAEVMLMVCRYFELDPFDFLDINKPSIHTKNAQNRKKQHEKQPLTRGVSVKHPHRPGKFSRRMCLPHLKTLSASQLLILHHKKLEQK